MYIYLPFFFHRTLSRKPHQVHTYIPKYTLPVKLSSRKEINTSNQQCQVHKHPPAYSPQRKSLAKHPRCLVLTKGRNMYTQINVHRCIPFKASITYTANTLHVARRGAEKVRSTREEERKTRGMQGGDRTTPVLDVLTI